MPSSPLYVIVVVVHVDESSAIVGRSVVMKSSSSVEGSARASGKNARYEAYSALDTRDLTQPTSAISPSKRRRGCASNVRNAHTAANT